MLNILDLLQIPQSEFDKSPFIVIYNVDNNVLFDVIDIRTNIGGIHPAGHSMTTKTPGVFATQGFTTFAEVPMKSYMVKGSWILFVQLVNSNPTFVQTYTDVVNAHLALPWYKKLYNWPEILGQAIGIPNFSFPGLFDCSMIDMNFLQSSCKDLPVSDQLIINKATRFINPEQYLFLILNNPQTFFVYGVYQNISSTAKRK